ncbi:MAG: CHAT domain-containing protein [Acidobacteria bacterium]|nr:CHAT domain-containing protein [Acidobacteriota bacterium]
MIIGHGAARVFLSPGSATADNSDHLKETFSSIMSLAGEWNETQRIIPIYLAEPGQKDPVASLSMFQTQNEWLLPYWDQVKGNTILSPYNPNNVERAQEIADRIAEKVYLLLKIREYDDVVFYLGQRGGGILRGKPTDIHPEIDNRPIPALVFNISKHRERTPNETIYGNDWLELQTVLEWSFAESLGGVRWAKPKNIYILGVSQLGIPFFIGRYFDRSTSANIYCLDKNGEFFNNSSLSKDKPLDGGNPYCFTDHPQIKPIPAHADIKTIALLLLSDEKYITDVGNYLKERTVGEEPPYMLWVQHNSFKDNEAVNSYIRDIIALLRDLKSKHTGLSTVLLFSGLPFSVTALLATQVLHVTNIVYMEYRKDLGSVNPGNSYVPFQTRKEENDKLPAHLLAEPTKTRILFVSANPIMTKRLELTKEVKKIKSKLKKCRDLELNRKWAVTMEILTQALLEISPQIVHFSGHGNVQYGILLEDDKGSIKGVTGEALGCLFKVFKDKIKCVILNACYSEVQARAIKEYIPYVIAMKKTIEDKAAIAFSIGFYQGLGAGKSIPAAFDLGLSHLEAEYKNDNDIAVLL